MAKYILAPIQVLKNTVDIIKSNNGLLGSFAKYYRMDDVKNGTLVGVDKYGNRYFENNRYFFGRNRWVEYNDNVHLDYDGSQVPAEWHGWLHYNTDVPPSVRPPVRYEWMQDHTENLSGTSGAWMPYSTTKPKIQAWVPPNAATDKKVGTASN